MVFKVIPILLLIGCIKLTANAQCKTLGQTPASAFPICATSVFHQDTVPQCTNGVIIVPGCDNNAVTYDDRNPFWYKFTCYVSGTLDFSITPENLGDDYDWQIFDVTGTGPGGVYGTQGVFVVANWSGSSGPTGTAPGNASSIECASDPRVYENTFSKPPNLVAGHNYLLLISHYTQTVTGYDLSFMGGSAVITDTTKPGLKSAEAACNGKKVGVLLKKRVKCNSLDLDGSDFTISPAVSKVISARSTGCSNSFDMDSVILTLDNPLVPGNYKVVMQKGNDDNTLLDNCDNQIPAGDNVPFVLTPVMPTPFDSIAPAGCDPRAINLVFSQYMLCSSVAPDGSDFVITGTYPVKITGASATCDGDDGISKVITIHLADPLNLAGNFQVKLVQGDDGNTVINECGAPTPAGETVDFVTADTVTAAFSSQVKLGCRRDTIVVANAGNNSINSWRWLFDDSVAYNTPGVTKIYADYGQKTVKLIVSNGTCYDTSLQVMALDNELKAKFTSPPYLCPEDKAGFTDSSKGKIIAWYWYFTNGNTSGAQNPPPQAYPLYTRDKFYPVRLVVENGAPCFDTAFYELKVFYNCYIAVPSAFTPNGDNINDYLYPLNAYKAVNLEFRVYNRWGQEVFETRDWTHKWDGTLNGIKQASGVYAWYLSYTNTDNGQKYFQKGTTVLIR